MINNDLDLILNKIYKSVQEISYIIQKTSPLDLSYVLGSENSSGEQIKYLDIKSNSIFKENLCKLDSIKYLVSEEEENLVLVNENGKYLVYPPIRLREYQNTWHKYPEAHPLGQLKISSRQWARHRPASAI